MATSIPSKATSDDSNSPRFVSYAQNFEDVMLWRALGHVENGFYVDVGAQDPILDSVSKAFYDRGWVGVDIEPVPKYAALLRDDRPRNRVLECALSDRVGRESLYVFEESGLSTLLAAQAERNHDLLGFEFETREVEVRTLRDVLAEAARQVHWLKIDVEGAEDEVLASWRGSRVHPWIVVVEATLPNERQPSHHGWEPILVEAGYSFVYFDGLNRFYVAPEHPELRSAFDAPPNVFDRFTLAAIDRVERSFRHAERYAKSLEAAASRQHEALRGEVEAQRNLAERRGAELDEAAVYAASLDSELTARGARLQFLEHEFEHAVESARIEMASQRDVAERRRGELDEATAYAASLAAEVVARGTRLQQLDEELARVRDLIERTQVELESQRDVATRRSIELEHAGIYAASLEAEIAARGARLEELEGELTRLHVAHAEAVAGSLRETSLYAETFAGVERYARSLEAEVRKQVNENVEVNGMYLRGRAEWEESAAILRGSLDEARDHRLAAEQTAFALGREVDALKDHLARWQRLAIEQAADWHHQTRALASVVGVPAGSESAGIESMIDDANSARAVHEATRAYQTLINAEVGRIVSELRRHEQRWYRRLNRRLTDALPVDRPASYPNRPE